MPCRNPGVEKPLDHKRATDGDNENRERLCGGHPRSEERREGRDDCANQVVRAISPIAHRDPSAGKGDRQREHAERPLRHDPIVERDGEDDSAEQRQRIRAQTFDLP